MIAAVRIVAVALVRLNKSRLWKKFSGRSLVSID